MGHELDVEEVPHLLGNGVLNCEVGSCKGLNVPALEIKFVRFLQVVNNKQKHDSHQAVESRDQETLLSLLVQRVGVLLALVLHIDLGRIGQAVVSAVESRGHSDVLLRAEVTCRFASTL